MDREQRERVILDLMEELSILSQKLWNIEERGKSVGTQYYMGLLKTFEQKLDYYMRVCDRHTELCVAERAKMIPKSTESR